MPIITLTTDFGTRDAYVGVMKGVILSVAPQAVIVDLSHDVPAQDVTAGALVLESAVDYFPAGTIHVAVVDPGVGTDRQAIAVQTKQAWLVGPDNGLLTLALERLSGGVAWVIDASRVHTRPISPTFHGRDVFAPAAALLAQGVPVEQWGDPVQDLVTLGLPQPRAVEGGLELHVLAVDRFGNLITDLTRGRFLEWAGPAAPRVTVEIGAVVIEGLSRTFSDVAEGRAVAYFGSGDRLEIAVRNGDAARTLGVGRGAVVRMRRV